MEAPKIVIHDINGDPQDRYTAGIELSNKCRTFYVSRLKAADQVRQRLGLQCDVTETEKTQDRLGRKRTSIDEKMDTLKFEMASLIDQDLALMKQLLTLNEQIEELKWQRKLNEQYSQASLDGSAYLSSSACTLSDTEDLENGEIPQKYPTLSSLSLLSHREAMSNRGSVEKDLFRNSFAKIVDNRDKSSKAVSIKEPTKDTDRNSRVESTSDLGSSEENMISECSSTGKGRTDFNSNETKSSSSDTDCDSLLKDGKTKGVKGSPEPNDHCAQQSFDSGIHDPYSSNEIMV